MEYYDVTEETRDLSMSNYDIIQGHLEHSYLKLLSLFTALNLLEIYG